jgi:hypothetical protein
MEFASAMSPSQNRHGLLAEPNTAESDSSENITLFADPAPEIFLATIPFPVPTAYSRIQYVQH